MMTSGGCPGDGVLFVKRKSLKRLRKMRRKAGPDAEGEVLRETGLSYGEGRGRRFPSADVAGRRREGLREGRGA